MKLIKNKHYHLTGAYFHNDEIYDFVTEVMFVGRDDEGSLWAMDKDGDEFEVLKEDLMEIKENK